MKIYVYLFCMIYIYIYIEKQYIYINITKINGYFEIECWDELIIEYSPYNI